MKSGKETTLAPIGSAYHSPEDQKPSWLSGFLPSAVFYSGMLGVVFRAASKAKKGQYDNFQWCSSSKETLDLLERVGVKVEVQNLGAVTQLETPCVIVGNHMSTLETFVLPYLVATAKPATFVVKKSLVEYPVFKHVMRSRDPVVVGRENPREDLKMMLEGGVSRLQAGISLIVFPQTTRSAQFDRSQFNSIAVKIAKRAGVPIVPLALRTDAWGNGKVFKDFGRIRPDLKVRFSFGDPMVVEGNGAQQQQAVVDFIETSLIQWGLNPVREQS